MAKAQAIRREPEGAGKDAGSLDSRKKQTRACETPLVCKDEKKDMETS